MKRWLLMMGGAVLLAAGILAIYLTPNPVLKAFYPKRYVLNCLVKTAGILCDEYSTGRIEAQPDGTHMTFSMVGTDKDKKQQLLGLDAYSDKSRLLLSLPQIAGDGYYGAFKGTSALEKYLTYSKVYNQCLNIQSTGKKYFGMVDLKPLVEKTSEYTLTFNQKGLRKTAELFLRSAFSETEQPAAREKINGLLDSLDPNTVIRLHTDGKNRIVSIRCELQKDEGDVFAEVLFKNDQVLLNNIEFLYYRKSRLDNLIVNIKSEGNHMLADGVFDDNTTITVVSSYVQLAKLQLAVKIDADTQGEKFTASAEGKVLMLPVRLSGTGNTTHSEDGELSQAAWTLSISDGGGEILRRRFDTVLGNTLIPEAPKNEFKELFDIAPEEKDGMLNRLGGIFQDYFIRDLANVMGEGLRHD